MNTCSTLRRDEVSGSLPFHAGMAPSSAIVAGESLPCSGDPASVFRVA